MMLGVTDAVLLLALGLGYIVCYLAKREEKVMQAAGYLIGVFIVVLSGILIVNNLLLPARFGGKMGRPGRMMQQPSEPKK